MVENIVLMKIQHSQKLMKAIKFRSKDKKRFELFSQIFSFNKKTSIELSKDEANSYTNKDGSMSIPQSNFTSYGINFWNFTPKPYLHI